MKRNGEIDFFRFVFATIIAFFHFNKTYKFGFFGNGYIGVEFFFVVSGFLMARHVEKMESCTSDPGVIADETWRFLLKKVKGFYRYYLAAMVLQVIVRYAIIRHDSIKDIFFGFLEGIPVFTLSFMGITSYNTYLFVASTWYLSAMLIACLLLYPVLLRNYRFAVKIVFPIIAMFSLGWLYISSGSIRGINGWTGLVYEGILRALGEMALGGALCGLSQYIIVRSTNRLLLTACKFFCYAVILAFAYGSVFGVAFKANFNIHALLFCAIGVLLSFSNAGYCIPDCRLTRFLGKVSLPIFIFHGLTKQCLQEYLGKAARAPKNGYCNMLISIAVSILLMYVTDFLFRLLKSRKKKQSAPSANAG